jgi:hypothetical protein
MIAKNIRKYKKFKNKNMTNNNNNLIPKENYKQVEEVRYLENTEQQQKPTITKSIKEAVLPVAHASDDDRNKRYTEEVNGGMLTASYANPVVGTVATGAIATLGGVAGLVGEATDNDPLKVAGDTYIESAKKPAENIGRVTKGAVEGIKKIFD